MTNAACNSLYAQYSIQERNLCANVAAGGKDSCQVDF